jgi:hypothetical protein
MQLSGKALSVEEDGLPWADQASKEALGKIACEARSSLGPGCVTCHLGGESVQE